MTVVSVPNHREKATENWFGAPVPLASHVVPSENRNSPPPAPALALAASKFVVLTVAAASVVPEPAARMMPFHVESASLNQIAPSQSKVSAL